MSRFLGKTAAAITPYAPGEQPRDQQYIKINTNECPYEPSPKVFEAVESFNPTGLRLYPDMSAGDLRQAMADYHGIKPEQVFAGGGSDEVLGYAFQAFFNPGDNVCFADITYGFYQVYADLFSLRTVQLPLNEDFTMNLEMYHGAPGHIFLANPNAPTGIAITLAEIEGVLKGNPNRLVVVDEAYMDFSEESSSIELIDKYDNLLVVQTFSKSRSLAGIRLGFGFGCPELIQGLERIKYSFNPYNIDHISMAVGIAVIGDEEHFRKTIQQIITTRERVSQKLTELGFQVLPSGANFLLVSPPDGDGSLLYKKMREHGILIRYFDKDRLRLFCRVTIGSDIEMDAFLTSAAEIAGGGVG